MNLFVSLLLVLWGCALGGSPSVQIGKHPLVQPKKPVSYKHFCAQKPVKLVLNMLY